MEVDSYVGELSGKPKEKETLLGFLRSLKRLRENFGHVHVNIGEPIALLPLLDEHQPEWREQAGAGRPGRHRQRRGGCAGPAHHAQHQRRRGRHAGEPAGARACWPRRGR